MFIEAERSSGSVFALAVIVIVLEPAFPLVGETLHQPSARSFTACALQAVDALKVTLKVPPSVEITGLRSVPAASSILSVGFGVGVGSVFSGSLLPQENVTSAKSTRRSCLKCFIRVVAWLIYWLMHTKLVNLWFCASSSTKRGCFVDEVGWKQELSTKRVCFVDEVS